MPKEIGEPYVRVGGFILSLEQDRISHAMGFVGEDS